MPGAPRDGTRRRVLALDPGVRRTGVAGTDPTGAVPLPLGAIETRDRAELLAQVEALVRERAPEVVAVGTALGPHGREGERARFSRRLAEELQARLPGVEVVLVDEALTTEEAHRRMREGGMRAARRKRRADAVAALLILERFLAGGKG